MSRVSWKYLKRQLNINSMHRTLKTVIPSLFSTSRIHSKKPSVAYFPKPKNNPVTSPHHLFAFKLLYKNLSSAFSAKKRSGTDTEPAAATMVIVKKELHVNQQEEDLFKVLIGAVKFNNLNVTLRCAGGWVRDKLLGKDSPDIDIALDNMMGKSFAEKVNEYLSSLGEDVHKVAVIESNPEQSKHLETARIKIHSLTVDLVNLRSEKYTNQSRVPTIEFGTPVEDAHRSMFYNINTKEIEDLTDKGIEDLNAGIIRTPLSPLETLLDDPLRVLRAVRFSARFGFYIDQDLRKAAASQEVRDALVKKVSRERIGIEVEGMFKSKSPLDAMQMLSELSLFEIVFTLPDTAKYDSYSIPCVTVMRAATELLRDLQDPEFLSADHKRLFLLASLLLPLREPRGSGEASAQMTKRKYNPASSYVIWDGLRWKVKDADIIYLLHTHSPNLIPIVDGSASDTSESRVSWHSKRMALGLWNRNLKEYWKVGVLLAALMTVPESVPLGVFQENYEFQYLIDKFIMPSNHNGSSNNNNNSETVQPHTARLNFFKELYDAIVENGVEEAYQLKPFFNGKQVMEIVGIKKGSSVLGKIMDSQIRWQLAHPDKTIKDCEEFLKSEYNSQKLLV